MLKTRPVVAQTHLEPSLVLASRRAARLVGMIALPLLGVACSEEKAPTTAGPQSPTVMDAAASPPVKEALTDGGAAAPAASAAKPVDGGGPYEGPYLSVTVFQAPIMSEMAWPPSENAKKDKDADREKSVRLGYIRHGEKVAVIPEPHKKSNCPDGWYELVAGGFVCGKYATLDLNHPRVKLAHPPDLSAALPYTYGINTANGTPIYRHVPSREERLANEPWLRPKKKAPPPDEEGALASAAGIFTDGGTPDPQSDTTASDTDKPWYMREHDGGAPQITLDELKEDGIVARRMIRGFFLSLDRQFSSNGASWWKTNEGLVVPADRVMVTKSVTEFHGVWLGQENGTFVTAEGVTSRRIDKIPVGFVLARSAKKWTTTDRKHISSGAALHRFDTVGLTGEVATIGGTEYWETDEGWWLRARDATKTEPGPAPEKLGANEKWIDVNLKRQTLVAFEGDKAVFATIISSGRKDHDTPPGSFRIREKHIAATMDGDADIASDGPYSIQDVPYIQYFNAGYALHGAFWHAQFGNVKSHGCVNMAPWDAKAVFGWTDPQLPEGWHGVSSVPGHPGTRVVLH